MRAILAALCLMLFTLPVLAVQPDEVLDDPALETRAREISRLLRCPVCQGESIDDSNAGISRDLRLYVRERLVAGDSDAQVIDHVTDRYGEFVLFQPRATGINWVLYLAAPVLGLLGLVMAFLYMRGRREGQGGDADAPLNAEEEARLRALMDEPPGRGQDAAP